MVLRLMDDIVEMIPIGVDTLRIGFRQVPAIRVGHLTIDIIGRQVIEHLYLHHVVSGLTAAREIERHLTAVEMLGHEPCRLP